MPWCCCAPPGMLVIGSVNDFILLFVSLELVTITFYVLTSFLRRKANRWKLAEVSDSGAL
jgi:NADH:ubiquinone oxidoreductase subunit 2 (subunit N)